MNRSVVHEQDGVTVVAMDSMSMCGEQDRGQVVVAASNGGLVSAEVAHAYGCRCVVLNDAGIGKDAAGIAGISAMDAHGIVAMAVGHHTAEISNGLDMWDNGVISHVNRAAAQAGFAVGQAVKTAVLAYLAS